MEYCAIFWMGGAQRGRWHSALPVASAAIAQAQVDALIRAGRPALAVEHVHAERLCIVGVPPTAWWDFEKCQLRE